MNLYAHMNSRLEKMMKVKKIKTYFGFRTSIINLSFISISKFFNQEILIHVYYILWHFTTIYNTYIKE